MWRHDEEALGKGERAGVGEEGTQLRLCQREEAPALRDDGHVHWQGQRRERLQEGRRDYGDKRRTIVLVGENYQTLTLYFKVSNWMNK